MTELYVSNVNEAFNSLWDMLEHWKPHWRNIAPRGLPTLEYIEPVTTHYSFPEQRVLFNPVRDANPFFHFFEALWILNGQADVETLVKFNSQMAKFSDDEELFHAPYGHRLRYHFGIDQLAVAIEMLREDPDTRQVVLAIWDPANDLNVHSKDIPCNDMIFFKIREGFLNMTVSCRSNDALLGCYGANVVQFSTIQEFVARAVGVEVGWYRQVSDSFHVYTGSDAYNRDYTSTGVNYYQTDQAESYPILGMREDYVEFLKELGLLMNSVLGMPVNVPLKSNYIKRVAFPLLWAWIAYKDENNSLKNDRIDNALSELAECAASDWRIACEEWLERRREV